VSSQHISGTNTKDDLLPREREDAMTTMQTRSQTEHSPATTSVPSSTARTLTVIAFVMAAIAVFFLPPLFGIAGVVCASIAMVKGDALGKWALTASIGGLVIGMMLGYLLLHARH
jgi:uncharacterized membrane protein